MSKKIILLFLFTFLLNAEGIKISYLPYMIGTHTQGTGWNEDFKFQGFGVNYQKINIILEYHILPI